MTTHNELIWLAVVGAAGAYICIDVHAAAKLS